MPEPLYVTRFHVWMEQMEQVTQIECARGLSRSQKRRCVQRRKHIVFVSSTGAVSRTHSNPSC